MLNSERSKLLQLINFEKQIVKAEGAYLTSNTGDVYLDFTSQYGAVPFGSNPVFLQDELVNQIRISPGVMVQPFDSLGAKALAAELVSILPGDLQHVTLACTGAEAVEAAIKLAISSTGRKAIVTTHNSFHGKTMGAAMATGNSYYRESFYTQDSAFSYIDYDDLIALEEALSTRKIAAFIVEPIQGEGGMIVPSEGYLKACQQLCNATGTLFVVDEIQTGLGRTGALLACDTDCLEPDIILLGKALGGGMLPISACVANKKAWSEDFGQRHSSTFANNHLAAHMGLCTLRELTGKPEILANVRAMGRYLSGQLIILTDKYPRVFLKASGRGLMQGLWLAPWRDKESYIPCFISESGYAVPLVASYLLNVHGLLTAPTLNSSRVLRIQPNYFVEKSMIDRLIMALDDVAQKIDNADFTPLLRTAMSMSTELPKRTLPVRCYPGDSSIEQKKLGVFAFLMHPTSDNEAVESLSSKVSLFSSDEIEVAKQWLEGCKSLVAGAAVTYHIPRLTSKDGGYVEGWLISSLLSPGEMMRLSKANKEKLLASYVAQAQSKSADVIGLGAFTSVISRGGTMLQVCGTPVTTGNAYTALSSTDAIRTVVTRSNRSLRDLRLGIVGASGSVGRLCLLDIAHEFGSVCLIGNARNKSNVKSLEIVAGEFLYELLQNTPNAWSCPIGQSLALAGITDLWKQQYLRDTSDISFQKLYQHAISTYKRACGSLSLFPLRLSNCTNDELPSCDVVLTATSNGEAFIKPEILARNAIVCDVARPSDLLSEVFNARKDVLIVEGGLVNLPEKVSFGHSNLVGLDDGVSLACLSETIILSMEKVTENHSMGGCSSITEARKIYSWATKHGFSTYLPPNVGQVQCSSESQPARRLDVQTSTRQ